MQKAYRDTIFRQIQKSKMEGMPDSNFTTGDYKIAGSYGGISVDIFKEENEHGTDVWEESSFLKDAVKKGHNESSGSAFDTNYCENAYFACHKCNYKTGRSLILKKHLIRTHLVCVHCPYQAPSEGILETHMMSHAAEKPFACGQCDFSADWAHNIQRHMKIHKPFVCNQCKYTSTTRRHLEWHILSHTVETRNRKFNDFICRNPCVCKDCGKRFPSERILETHTREVHAQEGKLANSMEKESRKQEEKEAGREVQNSSQQTSSNNVAENRALARFECYLCDFKAAFPHRLRVHMKAHRQLREEQRSRDKLADL